MPFQAERALEHVRALDFAREAGGEGERRAAGYVAEQLAEAGLEVERRPIVGLHFRGRLARRLGWPVLAGLAVAVCVLTARGDRAPAAALMPMAVLVWVLEATAGRWSRSVGGAPGRVDCPTVWARWPAPAGGGPEPPARVIFLTHLDTLPEGWTGRAWSGAVPLSGGLLLNVLALNVPWPMMRTGVLLAIGVWAVVLGWAAWRAIRGGGGRGGRLGAVAAAAIAAGALAGDVAFLNHLPLFQATRAAMVAGLALVATSGLWERPGGVEGPGAGDNRSGLAVLIELARTWSPSARERVEAHFVSAGGHALGLAGERAVARNERMAGISGRPTLVVNLHAPGIGPGLILVGSRALVRFARAAATDLWIPHEAWSRSPLPLGHRPTQAEGLDALSLVGAGTLTGAEAAEEIDSAAMGRAAQLATEVALRWARRAGGRRDEVGMADEG